jgi:cellulose synthase/poly-beta-1,6-N-acetylglucosamine synthase-like glycosyltransferase
MENKKIDWENLSNSSIKMNLESLLHEQISLRDRILKLSEKLEEIEIILIDDKSTDNSKKIFERLYDTFCST